jgi:hypothetical protein
MLHPLHQLELHQPAFFKGREQQMLRPLHQLELHQPALFTGREQQLYF